MTSFLPIFSKTRPNYPVNFDPFLQTESTNINIIKWEMTVASFNSAMANDYYNNHFNCRWFIFFLPFLSILMSTFACVVSYLINVRLGKTSQLPFLPFLGDIGDSSMFTLALCLGSMLTLAVVIIRYHQVKGINYLSIYFPYYMKLTPGGN